MTAITFAKDAAALAKGVDALFVIAPVKSLGKSSLTRLLGSRLGALGADLAKGVSAGDNGVVRRTLTGGKPRQLLVGALPDAGSRYNSPARAESIRSVMAAAQLGSTNAGVIVVLDDRDHVLAAANAIGRALPLYSAKSAKRKAGRVKLCAVGRDGTAATPDKFIREAVQANRLAARLVDTPPTEMHPGALATEAKSALAGVPHVTTRVITGKGLLRANLGGIHAVGRTAVEEPRMLLASYAPPRSAKRSIALVGKGVTYDTGGLHIKGRGGMESMKADMGGAAATLGAFRALAASGYKGRLHLLLCLAENAIGPTAYKPDDIVTMHSRKTVEINNTDAEGRILLADGVSYAARVLGANVILDAATLTGAQLISTGMLHAAVVSNDGDLEQLMVDAGRSSGDMCHPLPFAPEFYRQEFRSPVADMRNSVKNRSNAQSSCAAQFVWWHIDDCDVRWAHVDLAGPAWRFDRGTGFGVALLADAVRRLR